MSYQDLDQDSKEKFQAISDIYNKDVPSTEKNQMQVMIEAKLAGMVQNNTNQKLKRYDASRKKAYYHLPAAILLVVVSRCLLYFCEKDAKDDNGEWTTNPVTLVHLKINQHFFKICSRFTVIAVVVYFMRSIKMPKHDCLKYFIIFLFVFTRIGITIWGFFIFETAVELLELCIKSIWSIGFDPNQDANESHLNHVVNLGVYIFLGLFFLVVGGILIFSFFACLINIKNSHLPGCEAFTHEMRSVCENLKEVLQNWIYPEHILSNTAFAHNDVQKHQTITLKKKYQHEDMVDNFIESQTITLSTFLELHCISCNELLEDGQEVIRLKGNDEHAYHVNCLHDILIDKENAHFCGTCGQSDVLINKDNLHLCGTCGKVIDFESVFTNLVTEMVTEQNQSEESN